MKKFIISAVMAVSLFSGVGVASATDYGYVASPVREANCPSIDTAAVTQFFTAPDTCTRIEHRR